MNPNQPIGPENQREFTDEALKAKFTYSFTRQQAICLYNLLSAVQLTLGDFRTLTAAEIIDEIRRTAIASITDNDYKKIEPPKAPPAPTTPPAVTVN